MVPRARRAARPALAIVIACCLVISAGCSSEKPTTSAGAARTAWQQVLGEVGPEGAVSASTALKAFALAFGALPGVQVPKGPVGDIRSGSGAVRWLVGHWNEITAEQRAAAVGLVPELADIGAKTRKRVTPASYDIPKRPPTYYVVLAQQMADEIEAHVHVRLTLKLWAAEGRTQKAKSLADTGVYNASGGITGKPDRCVITVSAAGAAEELVDLEDTIGHEVWHCYQGQILGMDAYYDPATPSWIIEGQAEWVGDALRPTAKAASAWRDYVALPGTRLFARSYDAIGFYSHLSEAGVDTWTRLIPMLKAKDNAARFTDAGATSDVFLDTWASTYFRESAYGPAWVMNGPGLPATRGPVRKVLTAANGKSSQFKAPQYANAVFSLSSKADVLTFAVQGHARLGDAGKGKDYVINAGGSFCTKDGECACPEGSTYDGPALTTLAAESALAVTGGPAASSGTVTGVSLEEFCKKSEKKKLPDPCQLITQAEASAAAGRPARPGLPAAATVEGSELQGLGTGVGCIFRDAGNPSGTYGVAYVRIDAFDFGSNTAKAFTTYKGQYGGGTGTVKALGDDNFYYSVGAGPTHLFVRQANIILHISVLTGDGRNQAIKLATSALRRL